MAAGAAGTAAGGALLPPEANFERICPKTLANWPLSPSCASEGDDGLGGVLGVGGLDVMMYGT